MNAIAHAAEGLYARDGNPVMSLMAEEGIRAMVSALPVIRQRSGDLDARGDALYGTWLCGTVLGGVGMALHHKLCHILGGSFNLPHAEVHTVVLPHALAFNAPAAPAATSRIERAVGIGTGVRSSAAAALFDLARDNGAPVALRDIGMKENDLDRATDLVVSNPYWNPREVGVAQRGEIRELLQKAFEGTRPEEAGYLRPRSTGIGTPATALKKNSVDQTGQVTNWSRLFSFLGGRELEGSEMPHRTSRTQHRYALARQLTY